MNERRAIRRWWPGQARREACERSKSAGKFRPWTGNSPRGSEVSVLCARQALPASGGGVAALRRAALLVALWVQASLSLTAQVAVELQLEQEQYLANESLVVVTRVVNSSGQALRIGTEPGWLVFNIFDNDNRPLRPVEPVPLVEAFTLDSSKVARLTVDLMPFYDLTRVGRYTLSVTLHVPQLGQSFAAAPVKFDIINGARLWEREFGVPSQGVPEVRKYALLQANQMKQLRLYLRITNPAETRVFKVMPLGPLVSFSKPETQLDSLCNLHVLCQVGAKRFFYHCVDPDGVILLRQTYEYSESSRPVLRMSDEKGVYVHGGRRVVVMSDIPPPPELPPQPAELAPTNQPPGPPTNAPPGRARSSPK